MIDYDWMINEITKEIVRTETSYARKIASRVLGAHIDSWGDVKEVSSSLYRDVTERAEVQEAMEKAKNTIAAELCKPLTKDAIAKIAAHVRVKLATKLEDELYSQLYDEMKEQIQEEVKQRIRTSPKLAPYFVAGRIQGTVK